jgi:hypothetical protein
MLSLFMAFFIHILAPVSSHGAMQSPVAAPGHHLHIFDATGGPTG